MDDLFAFGGVCHDWRESYTRLWRQFMASEAPLVIRMKKPFNELVSFYSISDGKSHNTVLHKIRGLCYSTLLFIGFSSAYLILGDRTTNTLLFVNPFMRRTILVPKLPKQNFQLRNSLDPVLLAFAIDSKEYVIAVILEPSFTLYVYQSRKSYWEKYLEEGRANYLPIVDVGVLHHTLYAIDISGRIGVLSLNYPGWKLLRLNNTPKLVFMNAKLLSSIGQLLVVYFSPYQRELEVQIFMIDFLTMEWVKVETLGDRALFLCMYSNCYALSNPGTWGYDSNCVYYIDGKDICKVYSMKNELIRSISNPRDAEEPPFYKSHSVGWCFRNLHDEVDYTLGE